MEQAEGGGGGIFFFQAEDGIRDRLVTGVQTCALPICGTFAIPSPTVSGNPVWQTGDINFRLTTSSTNSTLVRTDTFAQATYSASGDQKSVV